MSRFLKAFFSFGLATSIEQLLGFIIVPIYTRMFTTREYGIIEMTGTVIIIAVVFGVLQLETALQRYYYEHKGVARKLLISNVYFLVLISSVLVAFIVCFLSSHISVWLFDTPSFSSHIRLASLQIPIQNLTMLGLVLLRYDNENIKFLIVIVCKVVFMLSCVLILVIHQQRGLYGVFLSQVVAQAGALLVLSYFIREKIIFRFSKVLTSRLFSYSLPQFPARVGSMSLGEVNKFFTLHFLSLQAIGIYSVSLKMASSIQLLNMAFIMAWAPVMHTLFKKEDNKKVFSSIFPVVCCATFMFVCLIALFSKEMITMLTSSNFLEAYKYAGGLALFFALYIVKEVVDIGPKITKKTHYLSFNFLISVIVNLVSLYFFIKRFDLIGVILAMILTNLVLVIVSWYTSNKLYYVPFNKAQFCVLFFPALFMSLLIMKYDIDFIVRFVIAIVISIFYGAIGLYSFRKLKSNMGTLDV